MVGLICLALVAPGHRGAARSALAAADRAGVGELPRLVPARARAPGRSSALGRRLDGRARASSCAALRWVVPGMLLGAVGPLGPRVLVFPVELLQRQDVLQQRDRVAGPDFDTLSQRVFVLQLVWRSCWSLAGRRTGRRSSWRCSRPPPSWALRNLVVASLVLPAGDGAGPRRDRVAVEPSTAPRAARLVGVVGVAALSLLTADPVRPGATWTSTATRSPRSPTWSERGRHPRGAPRRRPTSSATSSDYVYGPEQRTFYDDRFDMFPDDVTEAHVALVSRGPEDAGGPRRLRHRPGPARACIAERPDHRRRPRVARPVPRRRVGAVLPPGADLGGQLGRC